ncbi:putative MFS family arabinose efflux permease [Georgenia soli]|uniref:Putative MFS family arabinose efflux permease n=1 Tax=Georgenia soli TaxID=638953 RepID=A0A2A9EKC9_9MICO|nr:MFS transporter [Georgenia soli]PFG39404.1 putative MFS family arabinose efflux permease [Georgenia soli]
MPNPYREILGLPGTLAFSAAGLLARFPVSMVGIAIVLMLSSITGSYATAGTVSATFVIAQAVCAPQLARLVDRFGQARVMTPAVTISGLALGGLVVAAVTGAPLWTVYACAVVSGASVGSLGALVRARWTQAVRTPKELHRAYSWESALDESTFVLGPVIATILATSVTPWAGTAVAAVVIVVGGYAFLAQRGTEPPAQPRLEGGAHRGSVMRSGALVGIVVVFLFVGGIFGATDVSIVAFTAEHGRPSLAGVLLGIFSLGSVVAGLLYGAHTWTGPAWRRFVVGVAVLAAGTGLFLLVGSIAVMAAVMFVTGFAISPTIINGNSMVQHLVARQRLTEGLTWLSTGINVGVSVGSSVAGVLIDGHGSTGGFVMVAASGGVAVLTAVGVAPLLRRRDQGDPAHLPGH